jgi:hypothetical protein
MIVVSGFARKENWYCNTACLYFIIYSVMAHTPEAYAQKVVYK